MNRISTTRISVPAGLVLAFAWTSASAQTFTSADGPISVAPTSAAYTPASRYPSQITVPNSVAGTVTGASLVLHGLNADGNNGLSTQGLGILLVSPDGRQFELFRGASDGNESLTNVTLSIADANAALAPDQNTPWSTTTGAVSIKPTSYVDSASPTNYVSPGPGAPAHAAAPGGFDTLSSVYMGAIAAGTWKLFVVDRFPGDSVSFTSWDLVLTVAATQTSTTTALVSGTNPSFTSGASSSVTLTATVTSASGSPTGTVAFKDGAATLAGCAGSSLSPSGGNSSTATCSAAFGTEGNHSLTAVYSGGGSFSSSTSAAVNQFVKNHSTSPTAGQFCNTGPIVEPGQANTNPYPSVINIGTDTTPLGGPVSTLSLTLNGLSAPEGIGGLRALLVGPGGSKSLVFLSNAGFSAGQNAVNVTFSDSGSSAVPQNGVLTTGSYLATAYSIPTFPSPAAPAPQVPGVLSVAGPAAGANAQSFTTAFNGGTANGDWSLFLFDNSGTSTSANVAGGWCLNVTAATGQGSAVAIAASVNPSFTGNPVTITATVTDSTTHAAITSGTVTFTENGLPVAGGPSAPVALDVNGKAAFTSASLAEGDHTIIATFNGNANYSLSFHSFIQRVDRGTSGPTNQGNTLVFCNPNPITIPADPDAPLDTGAANPNPSNIFVTGIAGAVSAVSVSLNGFHHSQPTDLTTLLVGPQATNASTLDFFSSAGGIAPFGPANILFADTAPLVVPQNAPPAATNRPTSYTSNHVYTASPSGFYTLPGGPYQYAAPASSATFASSFANANPNGTWSLYFDQLSHETGGGLDGGWCLNVTLVTPVLSISKSHTGNFSQGQTGATYTVTVTNNGPGPTAGAVSVSDTVPSGLTATSIAGTGWNCTQPAGPCTRNDALPQGSSYPALTVTVNVAAGAPSSVTNQATVSGGGDPNPHTASDPTTISQTVPVTVTTNPAGLSFTVDGNSYTSSQTFQWVAGSSHTIATTSPQAGGTGIQYVWSSWSDSGAISHSVSGPSIATTYTAKFTQQFLLTTAVNPSGGGTVAGAGFYDAGSTATVSATANAGFVFASFSGTTSAPNVNPGSVLMDGPKTVTGNFIIPTTTAVSTASGQYSDPVTLTATVGPTSVGGQLLGGTVMFTVNGVNAGSAGVNASGVASVAYTIPLAAGTYTIAAQFVSSNQAFANSAGSNNLTVSKEDAIVTPSSSNPFSVQVSTSGGTAPSITLAATIVEKSDGSAGDVSNAQPVTCTLTPVVSAPTLTQTAAVSGGGVGGTLTATCTFTNVPVNVYAVGFSVGGNFYTGSETSTLAVYDPTGGFTTGSGTITRNDVHANFSFNAKYKNDGTISGSVLYIEHRTSGDVRVQSGVLTNLSVVNNSAILIGAASLNGASGYTLQLTVVDNAEPGVDHDTLALQLTDSGGNAVADLTFPAVTIDGGNIQIHN